jgi:hypothetical protein
MNLESQSPVRGLYDFWRQGTAGSPIQRRFVHVGTKIKMDDADGVFADVFTDILQDSIPSYSAFEGQLIISQTGPNMPMVSDGTTHTTMTSPTPNFSFSEKHGLRQWAAGVDAAPSHLFYSALEDPTDWTGAGSGDIAISPGDGDRITAIASHRNELFVFKGPYKGSIHRISGSAPTGDDAFSRKDFVPEGLGAVGQRSIFRFLNDLGFMWADGSIHSLNTTERYGDFLESSLSRPINRWLRENASSGYLEWSQAVTWDTSGVTRIALPIRTASTNSAVISMDFRFNPPRWSYLPMLGNLCKSLAMVVFPAGGTKSVMMGGTDFGTIHSFDHQNRTQYPFKAYDFLLETPFLSYIKSPQRSTIYFGGVRLSPSASRNVTFSWVRDGYTKQSKTFLQWTGDVLGPATSPATNFTLGTSTLAGERAISRSIDLEEGGEFQQIQYIVSNSNLSNDLHLKALLASIKPGATSMETVS